MIIDILVSVVGILAIVVVGLAVYNLIFYAQNYSKVNPFLVAGFSFILGNLVLCCILQILAFLDLLNWSVYICCIAAFAASAFLLWLVYKKKFMWHFDRRDRIIILFLMLIFIAILTYSIVTPLLAWDARAMWLLKAKSFFVEDGVHNVFFNSALYDNAHKDYPIGFSLLLSLFFRVYGHINEFALKVYLLSFLFNIVVIFVGVIKHHFKKVSNYAVMVSVLALFLLPQFIGTSTSGYADIPLALCITGIVAVLSIFSGTESDGKTNLLLRYALLMVLFSVLAMAFKNEGFIVFLLTGLLSLILLFSRVKKAELLKKMIRYIPALSLFVIPVVLWLIVKRSLGLESEWSISQPISHENAAVGAINYVDRVNDILAYLGNLATNFQLWNWSLVPAILLFSGLFIESIVSCCRKHFRSSITNLFPGLLIVLLAMFYFLAYLVTPYDIEWHMSTSFDRIIVQVLPAIYVGIVYYLRINTNFSRRP